jgi:alpha-L-fucosidase
MILATLSYALCNISDPAQQNFTFASNTVRKDGACVSFDLPGGTYNAPLTLQPCDGSAQQDWVFDAAAGSLRNQAPVCGGLAGACIEWSGQEFGACVSTPPALGPGCIVGAWPSPPGAQTSWNDRFVPTAAGTIEAAALSARAGAGAAAASAGLCVAALPVPPPPPPPLPTADILAWSRKEVMCLYDFDMCTYSGPGQGCNCGAAPPPASAWAPSALDTDSWIAAGPSAGCQIHILVAKHMCGFLTWNSTSSQQLGYNYSTFYSATPIDAVAAFVQSARNAGAAIGLYYSLTNNARTNTCGGNVLPNPAPGQIAVTEAQYTAIVLQHLEELWGNYGELAEVWFDGGSTPALSAAIPPLIARLQPHAVGFNAAGLLPSPSRWIGSESGFAPYPTWSTADYGTDGAGSPTSSKWNPPETDFTVLQGDTWFFNSEVPVRPPAQLRAMYEGSVGHNSQALIGIGIPPNGTLVGTQQAAALAGLGAYVAACYGAPLLETSGTGDVYYLMPSGPLPDVDRIVIAEDQTLGQRVRGYTIDAQFANGTTARVDAGTSVGNKKITAFAQALAGVTALTLNFTAAIATPQLRQFAVYAGCNSL